MCHRCGVTGVGSQVWGISGATPSLVEDRCRGSPVDPRGLSHVLYTCVAVSGEVWAFGSNSCGQLGIGADAGPKHVEPRLVKSLKGESSSKDPT